MGWFLLLLLTKLLFNERTLTSYSSSSLHVRLRWGIKDSLVVEREDDKFPSEGRIKIGRRPYTLSFLSLLAAFVFVFSLSFILFLEKKTKHDCQSFTIRQFIVLPVGFVLLVRPCLVITVELSLAIFLSRFALLLLLSYRHPSVYLSLSSGTCFFTHHQVA